MSSICRTIFEVLCLQNPTTLNLLVKFDLQVLHSNNVGINNSKNENDDVKIKFRARKYIRIQYDNLLEYYYHQQQPEV
jgi:hypothetical protein